MTFVAYCVPSGETWKADMAVSFGGLCSHSAFKGIEGGIINIRMSSITHSRNSHALEARKTGFSHILWVDSDMKFPPDGLERLLSHDKDIVGCFYPQKGPPFRTVGCPSDEADLDKSGLIRANNLGHGFLLVRCEVYDKLKWPWYEEKHLAQGDYVSEDFMFCYKCRAAGLNIWCDLDLSREMGHSGNNLVSFAQNSIPVPK